ncbi:UNVERIFIED_CONTAM: c-di-GMP-binding flagellar brake protein YcgR [Acetivibrio alkalicellulosi]
MRIDQMSVGLKLEIRISRFDDSKKDDVYASQLEWAESNNVLFVAAPIYQGKVYPISVETQVGICFVKDNNLYEFRGKVIDRSTKHNISVLKIETLSEIKKIQRREFFRFDCTIPINYRILSSSGEKDQQNQSYIKTITRDLSGGGVCIKLMEKVEYGKLIECELFLNDFNKVCFSGKVVRFTEYETIKNTFKYEIGVLFEKIDEKSREKIISYIFMEQRRLIKKG